MADYSEIALVRSMMFLSDSQAAIANNLANANTQGFKAKAPIAQVSPSSFWNELAAFMPTVDYSEYTNWQAGAARPTGEQMHVSLNDGAFFRVVDDSEQVYYTRRGDLKVDDRGRLVTSDGLRYLDRSGGEIVLGNSEEMPKGNLKISADGEITEDSGDRVWGPLDVVGIPDRNALAPIGDGVYRDTRNQITTPQAGAVRQGYLEQSNVQTVDEMVRMINVQRSFEATQKALTSMGRVKQSFVNVMMR